MTIDAETGGSFEKPVDDPFDEAPWMPLVIPKECYEVMREQIWERWPFLFGFDAKGNPVIFVPIWAGFTDAEFERLRAQAAARYVPNCCSNFDPASRTCVDKSRPVSGSSTNFYKAYKRLDNVTWIPQAAKGRCSG